MEKKEHFEYEDSQRLKHEVDLTPEDFQFTQKDVHISDAKFQSKPTTFFKDALKRFSKNKSSVVGAIILGILVILAFILPVSLPSDIKSEHPYEVKLLPKINEAGTGWWDGCQTKTHITYDTINNLPADFEARSVVEGSIVKTKEGENFTDAVNKYAYGGSIRISIAAESTKSGEFGTPVYGYNLANDYQLTYTTVNPDASFFDVGTKYGELGEYAVQFRYKDDNGDVQHINIKDYSKDIGTYTVDLTPALINAGLPNTTVFKKSQKPSIVFVLKPNADNAENLLISSASMASSSTDEAETMKAMSFNDANASLLQSDKTKLNWGVYGGQTNLYRANIIYCDFRWDSYADRLGIQKRALSNTNINTYISNGWMSWDFDTFLNSAHADTDKAALISSFKILNDERCPLRSIDTVSFTGDASKYILEVNGDVSIYRWLGYSKMPKYLFGTDASGKDIVNLTFAGLRTSLLLGIITSAVCFIFGLFWGAISGYFGGWADILMERFTEILGGLPWIVVMTICILKFGSNFVTFALALCLTGWMGTSSITRTQFYRYKDREYIFAARTLGASDFRLIFRHILPNAVGTIITSTVLMIPSTIFSEATISYLGLGLQGLSSLGVTLSDNQIYISTLPHLIMFPSAVMSLIMISFNLFGNGLRDAFNPSLKGEE
ncbi:MAG: ABC transporter permease [Bacilli bacterium]|jgi:ABC-type dipeptide/oligopeptide/nickel transport system permease subunit|nr:ABC transporter permease [Bacilli bacterium]